MSQKSVKFHIESSDYFGTLATVLSLIKQSPGNIKEHERGLNNVIKDLMYLQKEYKICQKKV